MNNAFISPTDGELSLDEVVSKIAEFLSSEPELEYRLVIGTDSQERMWEGVKVANFVTAVVIHKKGKGGRYFWKNGTKEKVTTIRNKIYTETTLSLDTAGLLLPKLQKILNGGHNCELEIHIDVGKVGKTREMIQEVVGMVVGNGYQAKTKPESFAASSVADKHA